ncbi:MAG: sulfite exporter TauE/SafE family protein [Balneolales bacterium]|nr:sulfite exporter TauE/SafE family protein [Balneolales bacterium]
MELYLAGFIFGLAGSMHCAGMCGPIALALPGHPSSSTFWMGRVAYNTGRSITYMLMGGILGLAGLGIYLAGFQSWVSIAGGIIIVLIGLFSLFSGKLNWLHIKPVWIPSGLIKKGLSRFLKQGSVGSMFGVGLINGLLPCGFVYIALAGALVSGSVMQGMIYMLMFGLGTFPMMFALSASGKLMSISFRQRMQKAIPYVAIGLGALFILRGLSLGIPYISPVLVDVVSNPELIDEMMCH